MNSQFTIICCICKTQLIFYTYHNKNGQWTTFLLQDLLLSYLLRMQSYGPMPLPIQARPTRTSISLKTIHFVHLCQDNGSFKDRQLSLLPASALILDLSNSLDELLASKSSSICPDSQRTPVVGICSTSVIVAASHH